MAQLDRTNRRLALKLVDWGPAKGGKTTSVRSLHAACDAASRGELVSVDTVDERTYFFDYAPMDLPKYRDFEVRVNCYTVPGQAEYVETRRRVLRGADGIVFVADASPDALEATDQAWRQLDDSLREIEGSMGRLPVVIAANKQDLPRAMCAEDLARRLATARPSRPFVEAIDTTATLGRGVVRSFRRALLAAADHVLRVGGPTACEDRRLFLHALDAHFGGSADGVPLAQAPERLAHTAAGGPTAPDPRHVQAALDATTWRSFRDLPVRDLPRERALARLLVDLGQTCGGAQDAEHAARSALGPVVMCLDGATGWIGWPDGAGGERTVSFDREGGAADDPRVAEAAGVLCVGVADGRPVPLKGCSTVVFPGTGSGGDGWFLPFATDAAGRRAWMVLVAAPGATLPADADSVLAGVGSVLALSLARIRAQDERDGALALLNERMTTPVPSARAAG